MCNKYGICVLLKCVNILENYSMYVYNVVNFYLSIVFNCFFKYMEDFFKVIGRFENFGFIDVKFGRCFCYIDIFFN